MRFITNAFIIPSARSAKIEALLLKSHGLPHAKIASILQIDEGTLWPPDDPIARYHWEHAMAKIIERPAKFVERAFKTRVYLDARGNRLPFRLYAPRTIATGRSYPLVLFFHGKGERGTDNCSTLLYPFWKVFIKKLSRRFPCFIFVPQCPAQDWWVHVNHYAKTHRMPSQPSRPERLALKAIASLQRELPIDLRRLYVTGLSMGGFCTWDLVARNPDLFAAAVPICGGGDETKARRIARVPLWVFHGDQDNTIPVARSRNMVAALRKAGKRPRYTEYPGVGHDSWNPAYSDPKLWKWLFTQTNRRGLDY